MPMLCSALLFFVLVEMCREDAVASKKSKKYRHNFCRVLQSFWWILVQIYQIMRMTLYFLRNIRYNFVKRFFVWMGGVFCLPSFEADFPLPGEIFVSEGKWKRQNIAISPSKTAQFMPNWFPRMKWKLCDLPMLGYYTILRRRIREFYTKTLCIYGHFWWDIL